MEKKDLCNAIGVTDPNSFKLHTENPPPLKDLTAKL